MGSGIAKRGGKAVGSEWRRAEDGVMGWQGQRRGGVGCRVARRGSGVRDWKGWGEKELKGSGEGRERRSEDE